MNREPLLSDEQIFGDEGPLHKHWRGDVHIAKFFREPYEAARAKDAELIQMAVEACSDPHKMSLGRAFLAAAEDAGFKPSQQ